MALWGTGVWDTAKWTEQVGVMAATETGVDVFSAEGDVVVAGTMAATESTTDTFAANGTVTIVGSMAAVETGEDVFAAEGDVAIAGTMAAVETGEDVFAATGSVSPAPSPVIADVGADDGKKRKKAQKKRDEAFEREKQERQKLREQIEAIVDPMKAKALPVVVSEGTKTVQLLSVDGTRVGINVPPAFDPGEVAQLISQVLQDAQIAAQQVKDRAAAQRALEIARVEVARIIKRKKQDELLLLLD